MPYSPYLTNPYTGQQYFTLQQAPQQNVQPQQIQNGGLVSVRSMEEARNYPIAPGVSVTFKDENAPYVYTKTMGFSQLDRPVFEMYRLIKEEAPQEAQVQPESKKPEDLSDYATKAEYEAVRGEIDGLRAEIESIRGQIPKRKAKKETEDDEA